MKALAAVRSVLCALFTVLLEDESFWMMLFSQQHAMSPSFRGSIVYIVPWQQAMGLLGKLCASQRLYKRVILL